MNHEARSSVATGLLADPELRRLVENASAVSFDFFDTLFTRPLANPEDAFDIIGHRYAMPDFRQRRRAAQAEAFRRMQRARRKEITLAGIYECFEENPVARDELMQAEYALELSLVEPIAEAVELLRALLAEGKPVAITSDMYLTADFFRAALEPHGLADVPLFVSASRNATKRDTGELFEVVARELNLSPREVLHIGDNPLADVQRPREKGMQAYHYRPAHVRHAPGKDVALATSLGFGLMQTHAPELRDNEFAALGFVYGGPATLGFLDWIGEQATRDGIEHLLFLSRDGFALERIARSKPGLCLPPFTYFLGSRTAFTLAAMTADNFVQFLPFLLSGSSGLAPAELLERIGVPPPAEDVMTDLGLGDEVRIVAKLENRLARFLYAYRWEILKVCQRNRRALYRYLRELGLRGGSRVAVVDVGWRGTTQEAFELALKPLMDLDVFGYYFCLADSPECQARAARQKMAAMVTAENASQSTVETIYKNRVAVELFFSAPHASVIGWEIAGGEVVPVMDAGRGAVHGLADSAADIVAGIEAYARHHDELRRRLDIALSPLQMAAPMIELAMGKNESARALIGKIQNFDAWSSSRHRQLRLKDYLSS
jgi:predicted HAD superfamily hydrolase